MSPVSKDINMSKLKTASNFQVIDRSEPVKLYLDPNDATELEPITIPELLKNVTRNYANHPALRYKDESTQTWKEISYQEYRNRVEKVAKVFIKLGLERHGSVAVLAFNSVEWFISELAAIHAG
jgi:long-chain-fatty-acid--CoA ligase ACSBG